MDKKGQFQRLLEFAEWCRKEYKMSPNAFEKKCHLGQGYFNTRSKSANNGNSAKNISPNTISRVCDAFPMLNRTWLILGEGEMILSENPKEVLSPNEGAPYYDVDFLGGFDIIANSQTIFPTGYIRMEPFNGKEFLWCNITGDSMSPLIKSGSRICMKQLSGGVQEIIYGEVYALVIGNSDQAKLSAR